MDIYAQREERRAVIEIIEARTEAALRNKVNRSTTNLTLLMRGDFDGALIGVYDEDVPERNSRSVGAIQAGEAGAGAPHLP